MEPKTAYDQDMKELNELIHSIDDRLRQVKAEIESLNAARAALDGSRRSTSPRQRTTATSKAPTAKSKPATAASNGATAASNGDADQAKAASDAAPARQPAKRSRRRSARTGETVPAGRLERLLSENGGLTTSALAERTDGDRDQILTLLRELERAGRIRRTGERRSTRWHAITDEDRIRERAAELERRRKRSARAA